MLSFHNSAAIKNKYVARVRFHREADRLIKGIGWQNGKGCAVGCTLKAYDHARYPIELGLPEWLARLEDAIFENLPNGGAQTWPERFLTAIPVGVNVGFLQHALAVERIDRLVAAQERSLRERAPAVLAALHLVRERHVAAPYGHGEWSGARDAAWSAAEAAGREAIQSGQPERRRALAAAASAAASAGWSAAAGADSAVESAVAAVESLVEGGHREAGEAWQQEAASVIKLLSGLAANAA